MAPTPTHDSAVFPGFHGCLAFLHSHFPPQTPPSHPLNLSLHSQLQPSPWDCSIIPKFQFPAALPCRRPASCLECMAAVRTVCLFLITIRLPQISCFTLLKCFSSDPDSCPPVEIRPPASVPPPAEGRSSRTNTPVFPPRSFILPNFAWLNILFSSGQVLLSTLSWCLQALLCLKVYS